MNNISVKLDQAGADDQSTVQALRAAFGNFPTGVAIITCWNRDAGGPVGVTANSFTSVSMSPPMVSWNLGKNALSLDAFSQASHFAVHLLRTDQLELAKKFSARGADKFSSVEHLPGNGDVPLLDDYLVRFECESIQQVEVGDHVVFFGKVIGVNLVEDKPLVFFRGQFHDGASCFP